MGPRACSFCVLMPISAPMPNWPPSVKAVERVGVDSGGIHFVQKALQTPSGRRPPPLLSDARSALDVCQRFIQASDRFYRQLHGQELLAEMFRRAACSGAAIVAVQRRKAAWSANTSARAAVAQLAQQGRAVRQQVPVQQQVVERIAHAYPPRLGVGDDRRAMSRSALAST